MYCTTALARFTKNVKANATAMSYILSAHKMFHLSSSSCNGEHVTPCHVRYMSRNALALCCKNFHGVNTSGGGF